MEVILHQRAQQVALLTFVPDLLLLTRTTLNLIKWCLTNKLDAKRNHDKHLNLVREITAAIYKKLNFVSRESQTGTTTLEAWSVVTRLAPLLTAITITIF